MTNFKMMLNLLCGAAIVFAIVVLQKSGGALAISVSSEIQEERCKTLVVSMEEEEL
jgi:hypothetical protein